ncbi:hypothetical protein KSS87_005043 [Heliosperma pusillum]|nr:hypothetical protein KSS87_005043 [Heliosperma pusillum]
MFVEKEDNLGLSLSLACNNNNNNNVNNMDNEKNNQMKFMMMMMKTTSSSNNITSNPLQLNLMTTASISSSISTPPVSGSFRQKLPWNRSNEYLLASDRTLDTCPMGVDVSRAGGSGGGGGGDEEDGGVSSPNSTLSAMSGKRSFGGGDETEGERASSRGLSDEEDGGENSRKKLRLTKDQSATLEDSFKEHNTLNPKQKQALAKRLGLRPRQVEVWFQNRRARTKLKQTEVDCEFLKRCCEKLTEENRRLQKEVVELRTLKMSPQFYMHMTPPTTLTMCPSCERVAAPSSVSSVQPQTGLESRVNHRPMAVNLWPPAEDSWNSDLLNLHFGETIARQILTVAIPGPGNCDETSWRFPKSGLYSVKSGYKVTLEAEISRRASQKDKDRMSPIMIDFCKKKKLWNLEVPAKWKLFLWRIMSQSLPVGKEFKKRNLEVDPLCKLCEEIDDQLEDLNHLFRDCSFARCVWFGGLLNIRAEMGHVLDVRVWIINLISYLRKAQNGWQTVSYFISTLWGLWRARNHCIFQKEDPSPHRCISSIKKEFNDLQEAVDLNAKKTSRLSAKSNLQEKFISRKIKNFNSFNLVGEQDCSDRKRIKCDAAWLENLKAGLGWVTWMGDGRSMLTFKKSSFAVSPIQAEALALQEALLWAIKEGFYHIDISSDCLNLILCIAGELQMPQEIKAIISSIRNLSSLMHCLSFNFCPRICNRIAHNVARQAV